MSHDTPQQRFEAWWNAVGRGSFATGGRIPKGLALEAWKAGHESARSEKTVTKATWIVRFKENGGEYEGSLVVDAISLKRTGDRSFVADGVSIRIDETIISVERA